MVETHLSHLLALGEERLPEVVISRVRVARDQVQDTNLGIYTTVFNVQVTAGVQYLDSTLCTGLDQLVVKVLYLQSCTFTTLVSF